MALVVLRPGPLATVQDRGRLAYQALGVGAAGAVDAPALALANRLVGNGADAAGIEITMGGLELEIDAPALIAVTGAIVDVAVTGGPAVGHQAPATLPAGARIALGTPRVGLRTYLAIRGGVILPPVLGSRSYDTLGRIGPPPLRAGDVVPVGADPGTPIDTEVAPVRTVDPNTPIRVWPGPRADWFADPLGALAANAWVVRPDSDRVGARLDGAPLRRLRDDELPSEGLVTGAIQVPHDGRPIVMLADHPVTGGYPVVGIVEPADLPVVAQARPGTPLRFTSHRRG
jgi:biotin-dependent carboxylase-like uncharacterized protein